MAQYTRTTIVDSSETGDSVKQAVLDVDADLTGIIAAYNTHDTATTDVHGCTGAATGTGALVRATSPTLVTPALGTPSAIILTNASGSCTLTTVTATSFVGALTGNVTGNVTGDVTGNVTGNVTGDVTGGGTLTSATFVTCALGTPSSGTLTNCTGLPIATGVSGLGTGVAAFLATPSSANLASAVTDETGSGKLVFDTSPTITTPTISGHPVIEGVTPTGATGTGKLVFDTSPTLVTPNIGAASGTSLTLSGLTASLPVFTDGSKKLVSKSVADTLAALGLSTTGVFNVKDYGATGNGSTDDTDAINSAITAAAALTPRGVVFFPPGTYNSAGLHNLTGLSGLQIIGSGIGSTIIDITHASNTLFYMRNTAAANVNISGFTATSSKVTRTGGYVIHVQDTGTVTPDMIMLWNSVFKDIEILYQVNGIYIDKYTYVWLSRISGYFWVGSGGRGIYLGRNSNSYSDASAGAELYISECSINGKNASGFRTLDIPLLIEDTDAVYIFNSSFIYGVSFCIQIFSNTGGYKGSNFLLSSVVVDGAKVGHNLLCTNVDNLQITNMWNGAAGATLDATYDIGTGTARGLGITSCHEVMLSNSRIAGNRGVGVALYYSDGTMSGCVLNQNGYSDTAGHIIGIDVTQTTAGDDSFVITGCLDKGTGSAGGGESIHSYDTADKLMVIGNRFKSGATYAVAPLVNEHNSTS